MHFKHICEASHKVDDKSKSRLDVRYSNQINLFQRIIYQKYMLHFFILRFFNLDNKENTFIF